MRMMMKVNIPVDAGNAAARTGALGAKLQQILADLKPEAVYFVAEDGQRTGYIFFDLADPSAIPAAAEPFFLAFNASITLTPAMTPQDLAKGAPGIAAAAEKYGKA